MTTAVQKLLRDEPVAIAGAGAWVAVVLAVVIALQAFGVELTEAQESSLVTLVLALTPVVGVVVAWVRSRVTPWPPDPTPRLPR